ncbi:MAG: hypothetical protein ACD_46C00524G0003 [uncultured bacterium]|nr:MAG: hypothetical protein ACD_46C00524G0003 [uncultured bacterium]
MFWFGKNKNEKYTGAEEQISNIQKEIKQFIKVQNELFSIDNKIILAVGLDLFLRELSWIGNGLAIAGLIGIHYFYANQHRPEIAEKFHLQLKKLYDIYSRCAEDLGVKATQDLTVINLLKIISPYIVNAKNNLILWDLAKVDPNLISNEFMEILSQSPHRMNFVMLKQDHKEESVVTKVYHTVTQYLGTTTEAQAVQENIPEWKLVSQAKTLYQGMIQSKWYNLFEQSRAEVNLATYGYEPPERKNSL